MASPLTVSTSTAGVTTTRSFGAAGQDMPAGESFAAMLDATEQPEAPAAPAQAASDDAALLAGFEAEAALTAEDPEAVAAVVETPLLLVAAETAKPKLSELVEGLAKLKAKLAAGETPDPELLAEVDTLLTGLAQQLGLDLSAVPGADDLAALASGAAAPDSSFAAKLVEVFGPLAGDMVGHTAPDAGAELSAQIKSVGDKLAALLSALNDGELDPASIADVEETAALDTALKAALASAGKPSIAENAAPVLAKPELKLPEAVLTSKTETAPTIDPAAAPEAAKPAETVLDTKPVMQQDDKPGEGGKDQHGGERKPGDIQPAAAPASDKPVDAAAVPQAPSSSARVDAVAAPRVVQVGYQTSQQQLNLPQIAFEVVRQVQDGNSRFQIRLDPAELGKIDVRLDIDASGQVNARLTVEKAETLDLMQRDQRALERALQQAGLDGAKTNLEFSLKQNPFGGQHGHDGSGRNPLFAGELVEPAETPLPTVNLYRGSLSASGVNILA